MTHQAAPALVAAVGGKTPDIDPTAFTAPTSVVVGDVTLAAGASIWYSAVLRADCGPITLGADSNVQDNCTLHVDPGFPVSVGERVSIGHNAVVHGCTVEDDCLIGMGATVLNGAVIGAYCWWPRRRWSRRAWWSRPVPWSPGFRRRCAAR